MTLSPATKYLHFIPYQDKGKKTKSMIVTNRVGNSLGRITFYGRWRQFVYWPTNGTGLNKDCMREIANKCEQMTQEWRESLKTRRS